MESPRPHRLPDPPASAPDWEAFYKGYKKPGYVAGYEIGNKLGGGVFGVVFKARKESIGKAYAIKFLRVEDPGVRQQVLHELDTVSLFAQVDHPNLVSIEDKGVVDGIPYIVMGYAGDETLKDRLDAGALPEEQALHVFVQVARGVQALHEHSLVHFDLKPANVFLKGDVARVGDYGLSKLITETAMSLTTGRGTPYYMAPEMLRRKGDHRSDTYSLGVILFECLSGEVPFKGDSEWEVLKGHEEKAVEFPDAIAARHRALLERMLAKEPDRRFQSVREVLQALRAPADLGDSIRIGLAPGMPQRAESPQDIADAAVANAQRQTERAARCAFPWQRARGHDDDSGSWLWLVMIFFALFFAFRGEAGKRWLVLGLCVGVLVLAIAAKQRRAVRRERRHGLPGWGWALIAGALAFVVLTFFVMLGVPAEGPRPSAEASSAPVEAVPVEPVRIEIGRSAPRKDNDG